jgi:hypothetical protein
VIINEAICRQLDDTHADTLRKWSYAWWTDEFAIDRWTNEGGALSCSILLNSLVRQPRLERRVAEHTQHGAK